ncbi:MAG: hypothetical protein A2234_11385 [Elusimicrobia bacterium RIFOXYA2_FULL_58_8]|nr:MAG: hypothetical protein A2234_11385 [Elusimicrobia bacterium RIFOXYA2_FULL_58_8]
MPLFPGLCGAAGNKKPALPAVNGSGRMELFFEPMDGEGWQLFFLADMVRKRLGAAELRVYPLVIKNADGTFSARRGEVEFAESRRLAVLAKNYPSLVPAYLGARSMNPSAEGWRDSALFAGVNPDNLERLSAAEGAAELAAVMARAAALGVTSTVLLLDGRPYGGAQRLMPLFDAVNAALPAARRQAPPAGYKPRPKAPPPGFWVVLSSGIQKNNALVAVFDKYFEDIKASVLDYAGPERAAKFPWLEFVPAYIISATPEAKSRLEAELKAGLFREKDGFLVYEDRQRSGFYAGRAARENTLELFVMSQCPYGVLAETSVFDAEKNKLLPPGLKVELHFIGTAVKNDKGGWDFSSLHGEAEWQENARQLFIARRFPEKFRGYLAERNRSVNSPDWQKAASAAGVDPAAVTKGFEEAKAMLAEDFAVSSQLGITTSPSFVLNGRQFLVGVGELVKVPGFEKVPAPGQPGAGCNSK